MRSIMGVRPLRGWSAERRLGQERLILPNEPSRRSALRSKGTFRPKHISLIEPWVGARPRRVRAPSSGSSKKVAASMI